MTKTKGHSTDNFPSVSFWITDRESLSCNWGMEILTPRFWICSQERYGKYNRLMATRKSEGRKTNWLDKRVGLEKLAAKERVKEIDTSLVISIRDLESRRSLACWILYPDLCFWLCVCRVQRKTKLKRSWFPSVRFWLLAPLVQGAACLPARQFDCMSVYLSGYLIYLSIWSYVHLDGWIPDWMTDLLAGFRYGWLSWLNFSPMNLSLQFYNFWSAIRLVFSGRSGFSFVKWWIRQKFQFQLIFSKVLRESLRENPPFFSILSEYIHILQKVFQNDYYLTQQEPVRAGFRFLPPVGSTSFAAPSPAPSIQVFKTCQYYYL